MWIGKDEIKLSLFVDNMIPYIENSKKFSKQLLGLIHAGSVK